MDKVVRVIGVFFLISMSCATGPATGLGSCDTFNTFRFDPSALEQCIKDIKFSQLLSENTKDAEISVLRLQLCDLALKLMSLKAEVNDFIKETCVPEWEAAKKRMQSRSRAKNPPAKK